MKRTPAGRVFERTGTVRRCCAATASSSDERMKSKMAEYFSKSPGNSKLRKNGCCVPECCLPPRSRTISLAWSRRRSRYGKECESSRAQPSLNLIRGGKVERVPFSRSNASNSFSNAFWCMWARSEYRHWLYRFAKDRSRSIPTRFMAHALSRHNFAAGRRRRSVRTPIMIETPLHSTAESNFSIHRSFYRQALGELSPRGTSCKARQPRHSLHYSTLTLFSVITFPHNTLSSVKNFAASP